MNHPLAPSRLRIIVLGYLVRGPLGGLAWHHLQYVMGLAKLGHEVYFLEQGDDDYPTCYDPATDTCGTDPSYGLRFVGRMFERVGLGERWAYHDARTARWLGPFADCVSSVCPTADLLLNISGVNRLQSWAMRIPARVLIDTDPVFTQIEHLNFPPARQQALQHTAFFSFGENIHRGRATVPDDGLPWQATRQPIVLGAWPATPGPPNGKFTTVMLWDSYPARRRAGLRYGAKSDSFEAYLDLPLKAGPVLELALGGRTAPRALLQDRHWEVRNPLPLSRDPWTYQRYIRRSKAEFSVAKHGYVVTRSGWFSERTACYLASGRPAVVQDTGFSDWLPTGDGVIPFSEPEEALAGIEEVQSPLRVPLPSGQGDRRTALRCAQGTIESDRGCDGSSRGAAKPPGRRVLAMLSGLRPAATRPDPMTGSQLCGHRREQLGRRPGAIP